jgi:hypothetical protein
MIWFSCPKCGKALSRPETSAGAFVFCDCGQGAVVPWDSTIPPPAQPVPAQPVPAAPPPLRPIPVSEEQIPVPRRPPPPPGSAPPPLPGTRDIRRRAPENRVQGQCFNHQDRQVVRKCDACGEGFCTDCLVLLKGETLCGPCKNYRLKQTDNPPALSTKATTGVILAIATAPVVLCLWPFGANAFAVLVAMLGLIAQLAAVVLGVLALRETEADPRIAGRSLAITTLLTGGLASVVTVMFVLFGPS